MEHTSILPGYWMDKEEEIMWAKDKICFQHLALNEMKQSTNTDKWVAGMIGTEIEVARTIEAWMQRRGGLDEVTRVPERKREDFTSTSPPTSADRHCYIRRTGRNAPNKKNELQKWAILTDQESTKANTRKEYTS
jgi:hypothetical protein